jgi:hypothetical protein
MGTQCNIYCVALEANSEKLVTWRGQTQREEERKKHGWMDGLMED